MDHAFYCYELMSELNKILSELRSVSEKIENKKNKSIGFSKVEALLQEANDAISNATSTLSVLEEND
ncbi:hypothetical protein [Carnobacterium maltaromaticum]|uniref:hypothetical protein n=1 Tax=Carnobacterium maltaromaticum TaxID=2751 RepID=UPI0012F912BE|nr:hypothetical protein [Carnobacterium maltaromaticum]